ncbi:DUF3841 domain-containing protein [Paenibacillus antri]|uniref:DUF3841 domain-containing protein n=1 Tax=Paenibacillus antri TaxID=2582848 RepID=A0A5R9G9H7_9BACL|nr:DUF3841 domain-containing protein [Paenibacillus antri]
MQLWSIQTVGTWEELKNSGVLYGKKEYIMDEDFNEAYTWLIQQMDKRLAPRRYTDQYPVWAWFQCYHSSKKRPDLRKSGHIESGKKMYCLK